MGQNFCYCGTQSDIYTVRIPARDNTLVSNNNSNRDIIEDNHDKDSFGDFCENSKGSKEDLDLKNNNNEVVSQQLKKTDSLKNKFYKVIEKYTERIDENEFEEKYISPVIKKIEKNLSQIENKNENFEQIIEECPLLFKNNKMIYKGTWNIKGEKDGFGTIIDPNGNKYTGGWKNDRFDGYGRIISVNGDYYEGEWKQGKAEGKGKFYSSSKNCIYEGEFKNNAFNGKGKQTFNNSYSYEGMFSNGIREGEGKYIHNNGNYYSGNFKNDIFNGEGTFKWEDGRLYIGLWKDGEMCGKGEFHWDEDTKYIGEYKESHREGYGIYHFKNGYYEGKWVNNMPHGNGKLFINGETYSGLFRYGKLIRKNTRNYSGKKSFENKKFTKQEDDSTNIQNFSLRNNDFDDSYEQGSQRNNIRDFASTTNVSKKSSLRKYSKDGNSRNVRKTLKKTSFTLTKIPRTIIPKNLKNGFLEKSTKK